MSDLALTLLNDYNEYLAKTAHWKKLARTTFARRRGLSATNLAVMGNLIVWCAEHGVEPRLWLYSLFSVRFWNFAPKFTELCSPKHLERFRTQRFGDTTLFSQRIQSELAEHTEEDRYDPNRDLTATTESIKRAYLSEGQAAECLADLETTLGFHPRSLVCARCPLTKDCAQKLQARTPAFDIMALRRGELTAETARHMALLHAGRP